MAFPFLDHIDLNQLEVRNACAHNLGSDPGTPEDGQFWFHTGSGTLRYYDGASVITVGKLNDTTAPDGDVSLANNKITNLALCTTGTDAANKNYVDSQVSGARDVKESARLATAAAPAAYTRTNSVITFDANGSQSVDGVATALNDRILLKDGAAGADNGLYYVSTKGAGGTQEVWTRVADADSDAEVTAGLYVWIEEGTVNADTGWLLTTNNPITLNSTSLTFTQVSALGQITPGDGLTKSGSTLHVVGTSNRITVTADAVDIASNYVGQTSITTLGTVTTGVWNGTTIAVANGGTGATTASAARTNLGATGKYSALIGDGSSTSLAVNQSTHGLPANNQLLAAAYSASTGQQVGCNVQISSGGNVTFGFAVAPATDAIRIVIMG